MEDFPPITVRVDGDLRKPQFIALYIGGFYYAGFPSTATVQYRGFYSRYQVELRDPFKRDRILG